jgi:hypothetical protein
MCLRHFLCNKTAQHLNSACLLILIAKSLPEKGGISMRSTTWILACITTLTLATLVFAGVPQTINYQGYLKNTAGTPVTTATSLTFRLYSSTRSGTGVIWHESWSVTPLSGVYSVELGSVAPLNMLPFDVPYFLGISVAGGSELTPLHQLTSTLYAIRAATVALVAIS